MGYSPVSTFAGEVITKPFLEGNTAFALRLYGELASKKGNLFFSPYSISSALGMTYSGARGNTAEEMKKALDFQPDQEQLPSAFKTLDDLLTSQAETDKEKLSIANGLCVTGHDVSKEFKALLKNEYEAELFRGDLHAINAWVAGKTEGKIPTILDQLDPHSVCVILNAIYFKATWVNPFKKSNTHDAHFKLSATSRVTVPFHGAV
jgi:serpin B